MKIAVDAMGGDNAPGEIKRKYTCCKELKDVELFIIGNEDNIQNEIKKTILVIYQ